MSLIKVKCIDQKLTFLATPPIYSGDVNTDYVSFEFCETWQDMVKTAVFFRDEKEPFQEVLVDDQCVIPHEVLMTDGRFYFGVFGVLDDKVLTSEIVYYDIGKGAMTHGSIPTPSKEIWQQILGELANIRQLAQTMTTDQEQFKQQITQDNTTFKQQITQDLTQFKEGIETDNTNFKTETKSDFDEKYQALVDASNIEKVFKLGTTNGVQNVQNEFGVIDVNEHDCNNLIYSGLYRIYETNQLNTPYNNGWTIRVEVFKETHITQYATVTGSQETYKRKLYDGAWTNWLLVEGEKLLWRGSLPKGQSTTIQGLSMYKKLRLYVKDSGFVVVERHNDWDNKLNGIGCFNETGNLFKIANIIIYSNDLLHNVACGYLGFSSITGTVGRDIIQVWGVA